MNWFDPKIGSLCSLMAPHYFAADDIVLTKGNDLFSVIRLAGVDFECMTDDALEGVSQRLHAALRNIPESYRIYQYVIKRKGVNLDYHRAEHLYRFELFLVVMADGQQTSGSSLKVIESELKSRAAEFRLQVEGFLGELPVQGVVLQRDAIYSFLGALTFSEPGQPSVRDHIDFWVYREPIHVYRRHIRIGQDVKTLTLRELPRATRPNLLSGLAKISCDLILCTEYNRIPTDKAIKMLDASEDHFLFKKNNRNAKDSVKDARDRNQKKERVVDTAAAENLSEVGEIKVRVANKGESLGEFSLTVVLRGDELDRPVAKAIGVVGNMEGRLELDGKGTVDAYLSIIPGNKRNSLRKQWLTSLNYADMALVYGPAVGSRVNPQFGKEYQILLETSLQTPYFFNHHQRYDESPDGICIGAKGSGKSVWANLQAHHLLSKYDPWVLILDGQGGSFRPLTEYHGGRYYDLAVDGEWPFTLNPFHLPDSSLTRQHLSMLIRTCCVVGGFVPDAEKNQMIYDEICRVMELPKDQRRLSALKLPTSIALYLSPWVGNGQYSFVFDNEQDTFALNRLQTIDFSAINSYPDVLQPLLFHFFHLWDRVIDNDSLLAFPKQMIFDEAWKLLNFQAAREYMEKAGRTWRKRNGMSLFLSQSIVELKRAGMLDLVQELFQQKFLFANSTASFNMYASELDLNEKVLEQFKTLRGKGDFLFISPYGANRLHTNLTELERFLFAKSPTEDAKRTAAIAEHGFAGALHLLAKGESAA